MKLIHVVGARPNFMKVEPVMSGLNNFPEINQKLVHTGQHYDHNMSKVFFQQLGLVEPAVNLEVGSASQAVQTANIMIRFEQYLLEQLPDLVLVYGDVNSTVAAALVCSKIGVALGHVEAGLRSFDRTMPEEINRLVTDQLSNLLFTSSVDGNENLIREGINANKIHFVGNVMIDTLVRLLPQAEDIWKDLSHALNVKTKSYGLITLHRPSNVDNPDTLKMIVQALQAMSKKLPLLFPIHPRTQKKLKDFKLDQNLNDIHIMDPISYLEFLSLQKNAAIVITDSGGIQEESTYLGIPCLTLRKNTERPITVSYGTNYLIGDNVDLLKSIFHNVLIGKSKMGSVPPFWDGKTGKRIAEIVNHNLTCMKS